MSRLFPALAVFAGVLFFAVPTVRAGVDQNVHGWLWSGTVGWISLNCTDIAVCDSAAGLDYGLTFEDVPLDKNAADLFGWAWSENIGWICFGKTCAGTTPEGGASYAQYRRLYNGKTSQLWGWAKVDNLGDKGWISLNCGNRNECAISNYYVYLNSGNGSFIPSNPPFSPAEVARGHWAWSANNDGTGIGWIEFTPYAVSEWLPSQIGTVKRPRGVYEPAPASGATPPGTHQYDATIDFAGFVAPKNALVQCEIDKGGAKQYLTLVTDDKTFDPPGIMEMSYRLQQTDPLPADGRWYLNYCFIAAPPRLGSSCIAGCEPGTICDDDYGGTTGRCRTIVDRVDGRWPVFVHGNTWTKTDQDKAQACFAGTSGAWFDNVKKCDMAGDVAFATVMRRGLPREADCEDTLDGDANGFADLADRYCRGFVYGLNPALSPLMCTRGSGNPIDCGSGVYSRGHRCCGNQPTAAGSTQNFMADGTECRAGDPNDGYFDCACTAGNFGAGDCYAPGAQAGEYCCTDENLLKKL